MTLAEEFGSGQVLWSMFYFFLFFIWIYLLIIVFSDIFRSDDLGGWAKALWVIFVIVLPYLGVFVYLIARGNKMSEHAAQAAQAQNDAQRGVHPERCRLGDEHGRRTHSSGGSQGKGRHLRRRVRPAQGEGPFLTELAHPRDIMTVFAPILAASGSDVRVRDNVRSRVDDRIGAH